MLLSDLYLEFPLSPLLHVPWMHFPHFPHPTHSWCFHTRCWASLGVSEIGAAVPGRIFRSLRLLHPRVLLSRTRALPSLTLGFFLAKQEIPPAWRHRRRSSGNRNLSNFLQPSEKVWLDFPCAPDTLMAATEASPLLLPTLFHSSCPSTKRSFVMNKGKNQISLESSSTLGSCSVSDRWL